MKIIFTFRNTLFFKIKYLNMIYEKGYMEVIKIYKNKNDTQFRRSIGWLEDFKIPYEIISKTGLLPQDIKQILKLSDKGFEDILISKKKATELHRMLLENCNEMKVEELIEFLLEHQSMLRSPILFDEKHLLIGYNSDAIRVFIPRFRRTFSTK